MGEKEGELKTIEHASFDGNVVGDLEALFPNRNSENGMRVDIFRPTDERGKIIDITDIVIRSTSEDNVKSVLHTLEGYVTTYCTRYPDGRVYLNRSGEFRGCR
jgi:hypothetical protein